MEISEVLRLAAGSHLLLLFVILVKDHRDRPVALATAVYALLVVCHLGLPLALAARAPRALTDLLFLGGAAVAPGFWILSRWYFDDDFGPGARHGGLLLAFLALQYGAWWSAGLGHVPAHPAGAPWTLLAKVLAGAVVLHALVHVLAGLRSDLVEARVRVRYVVLTITGAYVLAVIAAEAALSGGSAQRPLETVNAAAIYALVLFFSTQWFGIQPDFLRTLPSVREPAPAASPAPLDPRLRARLQHLMEVEEVFKEEGLTIVDLARRLGVNERKARQLINSDMGFRNFNAYVNMLRITRARQLLIDPVHAHLGVADVAFSLGFSSLGPFNRAFRELTGKTPSEYRREAGVEGEPAAPATAASGDGP